ncbi:MFS transporter [Couchioplanes caeruleus]|uniref:MFS transporter n=2 Tax=Couchioplanes caeruleus TaxID=56438 RepID=A0A1K0FTQ5_9ACTN|nr:MFS transporter [Couchioplanes caeruleus]OJF16247.1 MFS transporter [Couchioplanes caeruleus subsp. caeruleus]ROP28800.1 MFS transporter [Couchioplanes caeruleus]
MFSHRYAIALAVDALGSGLLRPFLLLYGLSVLHLSVTSAGLALSAGLLAGLAGIPLLGRWIDAGGRRAPMAATMFVRAAGIAVLLAGQGMPGYLAAALLLGAGGQALPAAQAALVAALTDGPADRALALARTIRNAGLGVGALVAGLAVTGGTDVLRLLAVINGAGYLLAGALILSLPRPAVTRVAVPDGGGAGLGPLAWANLPYALCFGVLEVALPALLVTHLDAAPGWSAALFAGNTVLVVALQVFLVVRLHRLLRRTVLAAAGVVLAASYLGFWAAGPVGPAAVALVAVPYTLGEILYAGSGTALVAAAAPPATLGRALARWQLSTGIGNAAAPAVLTTLLSVGPGLLWGLLAGSTLAAAAAVRRWAPAV